MRWRGKGGTDNASRSWSLQWHEDRQDRCHARHELRSRLNVIKLLVSLATSSDVWSAHRRTGWLTGVQGVSPRNVLAMTFTNKAAGEMAGGVDDLLLPVGLKPPLIATFHSVCVRMLRQHGKHIELPPSFVIYDEDDRQSL